jgi:hypothetical protein
MDTIIIFNRFGDGILFKYSWQYTNPVDDDNRVIDLLDSISNVNG